MRMLGSIVLLSGGLSAAAYAYFPVASFDEQNLVKLIEIQAPSGREASPVGLQSRSAPAPVRIFSPRSPAYASAVASTEAPRGAVTAAAVVDGAGNAAWRPIVTPEANSSRPAESDYASQVALARELQRELKRVGCYDGDPDGDWKTASRRAMGAFLGRINASLPVDHPDLILLTLLQAHPEKACGATCPAGQSISSEGRCVAKAVVASSGSVAPAAGRVATGSIDKGWYGVVHKDGGDRVTTANIVPPAPTPAVRVRSAALARPVDELDAARGNGYGAREPLPGRMSIGAPIPAIVAPAPSRATPPIIAEEEQGSEAAAQRRYSSIDRSAPIVDPRPVLREKPRYSGRSRVQRQHAEAPRRPGRRKLNVTDLMRQLNGF